MNVRELKPSGAPLWLRDVLNLLEEAGPLSPAETAGRLGIKERAVQRALVADPRVHETEEGWYHLETVAGLAVFTHIVTEAELQAGVLVADEDLSIWARLAADGIGLRDGRRFAGLVRTDWDNAEFGLPVLTGPDGWLKDFAPDDVLAVRLRGTALEISTVTLEETVRPDAVTKLIEWFSQQTLAALAAYCMRPGDGAPGVGISDAVADLLVEHELFNEPLPPLGALLRSVKFEVRDGFVALAGAPWDPADVRGLEGTEIMDFAIMRGALRTADDLGDLKLDGLWNKLTRSSAVLAKLADEVEFDPLDEEVITALRAAASTPAQQAAVALLAARCAEGDERPADAMKLIEQALDHDPDLVPALSDAAEYAACSGDMVRADGLLRRAGLASDEGLRQSFRPLLAAPAGAAGRNQPCPCGSGQKYKKCCLGNQAHPLPARAKLLYGLLFTYTLRAANRIELERLAQRSSPAAEGALIDLALFECEVAGSFADERGAWLREDERELLAQWCRTPLHLYEVTAVRPGTDVAVRSLSGEDNQEVVVLRDRTLSRSVRRLDLMLARLLEDGTDRYLFCSPFQVNRLRRGQMLELLSADHVSPYAIAEFFGPQRLPRLANRDGHELMQCTATYEVADGDWAVLAESLDEDGPDRLVANRGGLIRGFVRRDGTRWTIEANSLERLRELQDLLVSAAPQARLVSESSVPMDKVMEENPSTSATPSLPPDVSPEEVERIMEDFMVEQEKRWVDEEIPALGGLTPRQAVERGGSTLDALNALLDDFDWAGQRASDMSGRRIRGILGLS